MRAIMTDANENLLRKELASALGREASSIKVTDRIIQDLGAESLDLVDITFRLEKTFSIQIPVGDLFEATSTPHRKELTMQDLLVYIAQAQACTRAK